MSVYGKMKSRTAPDYFKEYRKALERKKVINKIKLYLYKLENNKKAHEVLFYWYSTGGEFIKEVLKKDKKNRTMDKIYFLLRYNIPHLNSLDFTIENALCSDKLTIYNKNGKINIIEKENKYTLRIEIYYNKKFAKRDYSRYRLEDLLNIEGIDLCYDNKKYIFKF